MGLGAEVAGLIGGGAVVGYFLDQWLDTEPFMVLAMVLVGTVAAFTRIFVILRWLERHSDSSDKP